MKLTKEHLDSVRHIEGFPIGRDEDIIALSQPPYYTACPNPFIEDFIKQHGKPYDEATDTYHREPFAADVSEGKNDPIYNAHSYHTKVPYKAIMRYILHYTDPGDIVFDGFCGTGMTGVAAQMCGNPDPAFKMQIEKEMPYVKWGARKVILNDLSPAATFIAANYNLPVDVAEFEKEAKRILDECEKECRWMYETLHTDEEGNVVKGLDGNPIKGKINYVVWSDVFVCPHCSKEFVFWDVAVDKEKGKVSERFRCPHCLSELKKTDCDRAQETVYDRVLKQTCTFAKQVPVLINYSVGKKRYEKKPDAFDFGLLKRIEEMDIPYWYPTDRMPEGYNTEQPKKSHGITHVHHFYTKRNLAALSLLRHKMQVLAKNRRIIEFLIESYDLTHSTKMSRIIFKSNNNKPILTGNQSGTLYLSSLPIEKNIINGIKELKLKVLKETLLFSKDNLIYVTTQSLTQICNIPSNTIDYIFTDPPFGSNLMYSELNFLWEAWLKVFTNNKPEAVVNKVQKKGLAEYQELMERCFAECYRILKPGRWMTVEFHNSSNAVWNAIQEALLRAGFVVADVRTLDKKQGSFKQVTTSSAVKQDLIISAYKPRESFKRRFLENAGSEEAVWEFVRQHLEQLPVVIENNGKLEVVAERQAYMLFDRMVAYHVVNGIPVPMDASEFYKGLEERFIERDGMYFLPDQVNQYDEKRLRMDLDNVQLSLIITDEKSAIQWLYRELSTPQTYQEIQPKFIKELHQQRYEKMPELREILEENFLQDEEGRWYVPDLNKASDLVKLRQKRLLKEFEEYTKGTGKLKVFRMEAVRAGFEKCWKDRDFATIVKVARRLPESVVQEDPAVLMYYDNALSKLEG
ncbi:site-specific DNA-methyltransferase [Caldicoprobacter algeriensis]|uniref:DNA methyltransferase n=1 Tax=Caldicoprobacter algeriensis TaxID=699281 RepID=UPI0020792742|nr:DNA methyltransferase [Caldicoprobacter algeriensis]MCM8899928.1 site-specific DNA-methyltransferase [Caldicoprobacter algeriensis]